MGRRVSTSVAVILLVAAGHTAAATTFTAEITDQDGKPVPNAVVSLVPESKTAMPAASSRLPNEKTIDQRSETFVPIVTIVPRNGRVIFANSDPTTHQVYSFSPAKQFEITLARDTSSPPIVFPNAGVAALGCNIHDNMIAYVFVTAAPFFGRTDARGQWRAADVQDGRYRVRVWHPLLNESREVEGTVGVSGARGTLELKLSRALRPAPLGSRPHTWDY